ncbi:MAG TPA: hypothetical protein VGS97_25065 [Actinocrinis sp.]|uniref:hypothetical protein n=1 Tax=Actinocrinis sp. TaxID=1920516 RepID=UPI002DDCB776|nr:hypothetical protein [Actinocrinis sp.]HEV2347390.1 hypothetical protein [Actinocrinis sp.]
MILTDAVFDSLPPEVRAAFDANPGLRDVLAGVMESAVPAELTAMLTRAEAAQFQQRAADLLDQADRIDHQATLAGVSAKADAALAQTEDDADRLAAELKALVEAERDAADKSGAAADHARELAELAEDLASQGADPAQQTDAIVRRDAARQVADRFHQVAERTTARRVTGEADLTAARGAVRQAKAAAKTAHDAESSPGTAPLTWWTLQLDGIRRLMAGQLKAADDKALASELVEQAAVAAGVDKLFAARTRQKLADDERARVSQRLLAPVPTGNRDASTIVAPPGVGPIAPLAGSR